MNGHCIVQPYWSTFDHFSFLESATLGLPCPSQQRQVGLGRRRRERGGHRQGKSQVHEAGAKELEFRIAREMEMCTRWFYSNLIQVKRSYIFTYFAKSFSSELGVYYEKGLRGID